MDKTQNQNSKKGNIIVIILSVVVIIVTALFVWQHMRNSELKEYFQEEQMDLESNFRSLIQEYDSLQVVNNYDSLLIQLDVEQQRVSQLLDELETVKATNAVKLRKYRKELSTMRVVMKHYVVQIDSLNRANEELTEENQYVKKQYKAATQTVLQLEEEKEVLSKTIAIASQLEINEITVSPLNSKGRSVRKLSKTERFKISFAITKNITTDAGYKTVFLRITSPQREVLPSGNDDTFVFEDKKLSYSAKRQFEYEAEELEMDIFYDINQFLFAGEYQFDLFVDGVHIGNAVLEMRD